MNDGVESEGLGIVESDGRRDTLCALIASVCWFWLDIWCSDCRRSRVTLMQVAISA